jgi:hypothetical protein
LKHSVSYWPFADIPLKEFAEKILPLGYTGIDLLHPEQAKEIADLGVTCPITAAPEHESGLGGIEKAFNRSEHHPTLHKIYRELIPAAAEAGIPQAAVDIDAGPVRRAAPLGPREQALGGNLAAVGVEIVDVYRAIKRFGKVAGGVIPEDSPVPI